MNEEQLKRLEDEIEHKKRMLEVHISRKRILELQQAQQGFQTPPHITKELDDLKRIIDDHKRDIGRSEGQLRVLREQLAKSKVSSVPRQPANTGGGKQGPSTPRQPANTGGGKQGPSTPRQPANTGGGKQGPSTPRQSTNTGGGKQGPSGPRQQPANTSSGQQGPSTPRQPTNTGSGKQGPSGPRQQPANTGGSQQGPSTPRQPANTGSSKQGPLESSSKLSTEEQIAQHLPQVLCVIYMEGYQNNTRVYVYGSVAGNQIEALVGDVKGQKSIDIVKGYNFSVIEQGKATPSGQVMQRINENYHLDHRLTRVHVYPSKDSSEANTPPSNTTTQASLFEQLRRNLATRLFRTDTSNNSFQISRVSQVHIGLIAVFNPDAYNGVNNELHITAELARQLAKLNTSDPTIFAVSKKGQGEEKIEAGKSLESLLKRVFPRQPST